MIAGETTRSSVDYQDLFSRFAGALQEHLDGQIDEARVREIVDERIDSRVPRTLEIRIEGREPVQLSGRTHKQFDEVMSLVAEGHRNIMLVGPAGSGKTTLAHNVAEALGLEFAFISLSAGVSETHLLGRMLPQADGTWAYQPSKFVQIYQNGGVFLLDEVDAADANLMVAVNAALANGFLSNPINGEVYQRHSDAYIIAAANTWGQGGDCQYVGRNQLDAATLDRFTLATVVVGYDDDLEADLCRSALTAEQADELLGWVRKLRERIAENRLRRVASTRLVVHGIRALKAGRSLEQVKARYFVNWSPDEKAKAEEG